MAQQNKASGAISDNPELLRLDLLRAIDENHTEQEIEGNFEVFKARYEHFASETTRFRDSVSEKAKETHEQWEQAAKSTRGYEKRTIVFNLLLLYGFWTGIEIGTNPNVPDSITIIGLRISGLQRADAVLGVMLLILSFHVLRSWQICKMVIRPLDQATDVNNSIEERWSELGACLQLIEKYIKPITDKDFKPDYSLQSEIDRFFHRTERQQVLLDRIEQSVLGWGAFFLTLASLGFTGFIFEEGLRVPVSWLIIALICIFIVPFVVHYKVNERKL